MSNAFLNSGINPSSLIFICVNKYASINVTGNSKIPSIIECPISFSSILSFECLREESYKKPNFSNLPGNSEL